MTVMTVVLLYTIVIDRLFRRPLQRFQGTFCRDAHCASDNIHINHDTDDQWSSLQIDSCYISCSSRADDIRPYRLKANGSNRLTARGFVPFTKINIKKIIADY